MELSAAIRDQAATRLELRMGDPLDSEISTRKARDVPRAGGRGLTADSKLHFLGALPRIDSSGSVEDLAEGVADFVTKSAAAWPGEAAPKVRMLPPRLPATELPEPVATEGGGKKLALGLDQEGLKPVWHDFSRTPHLTIVGDSESGKTNVLRRMAEAISSHYTPEEAKLIVVDYRRELVEAIPEEHRLAHVVSLDNLKDTVNGAARAMQTRQPGPEITPGRMRQCDWWSGPRLFVLVDDYELVAGNSFQSPFEELLDHLPLGFEVGLHLIVARSAMGVGRGLNEALLRRLDENNNPALLMSCPPSEGYVFGTIKPRNLPPGRALHVARRKANLMQLGMASAPQK